MKRDWVNILLIILLLAGLGFLIYRMTGGHLPAWQASSASNPFDSFLGGITNGLQSMTDGIGNIFGGLRP